MRELDLISDEELLGATADGDSGALRCLYYSARRWLLARMRRRCDDDDVAGEALQDTFVAVGGGPPAG